MVYGRSSSPSTSSANVYEFTETKDKPLFRLGVGYEFHLGGNWNLAPELSADFIDGGATIWLAGVAIGFGF